MTTILFALAEIFVNPLSMPRDRVLVDVFFLGVVDAHKGLDRLDHALRVADQIAVGILVIRPSASVLAGAPNA